MNRNCLIGLLVLLVLLINNNTAALTYYVCGSSASCGSSWITGNDINSCTNKTEACLTIYGGILKMAGGDELVIGNGTYSGTSNRIHGMPSGNTTNYTNIHAEYDWGVTLSDAREDSSNPPIEVDNRSYVQIRGFHVRNSSEIAVSIGESSGTGSSTYVKIIRCSDDGNGGGNPSSSFTVMSGSQYVLIEECFTYGAGRYPFGVSMTDTQYVVFRRNVCRWDYSDINGPQACFNTYDRPYVYFQNNIAIDGLDIRAQEIAYDGLKGFFTANGASNVEYQGCISLNMEGAGFWIEDSPLTNVSLTDCISWDSNNHTNAATDGYPPRTFYARPGVGPINLTRCTFGQSNWTSNVVDSDTTSSSITNSIIANFTALADGEYAESSGFGISDYNDYYGNTGGRDKSGGIGPNSITLSPFQNGLSYLPRIENGSVLKTAGEGGSQIGAQVIKRIGISGTLYGESGWNETTSEDLWPFPNEDAIKNATASFYMAAGEAFSGSPELIGARGFSASGNGLYGGDITLTSYIWEYLGNSCPADICNYSSSSDTTPPVRSSLQPLGNLSSNTTSTNISLATNENSTCRYSTTANTNYSLMNDTFSTTGSTSHSTTVGGLSSGNSYSFYVRCNDSYGNFNTNDSIISFGINSSSLSCTDADGDNYNQSLDGCGIADCNDSNSSINPSATEICGNGIDEDCDGNDSACSTSPSGGSGGGGGGSSSVTYHIGELLKINKALKKGEKINFSVLGVNHTFEIKNIISDSVLMLLMSNPISFTLKVGESMKANLSSFVFYNILVTLEEISSSKANVTLQSINEAIPSSDNSNSDINQKKTVDVNNTSANESTESQENANKENKSSAIIYSIVIPATIIALAALVFIGIRMRQLSK